MNSENDFIIIKSLGRYMFLRPQQVDWVVAEGNYVRVYCQEKHYLVRETLKEICKRLDSTQFVRINRSVVLNIRQIKEVKQKRNSVFEVRVGDGRVWNWSEGYRANLDHLLRKRLSCKNVDAQVV